MLPEATFNICGRVSRLGVRTELLARITSMIVQDAVIQILHNEMEYKSHLVYRRKRI